ncbi:MAG: ATP-binding cassette domain-containing protein [Bacteroidia bacterium]
MNLSIDITKPLAGPGEKYHLEVRFRLEAGKVLAIMGPSGAGKTSLLKMIAGLMPPETGRVIWGQEVWFDQARKIVLPTQKRSVGMVFQDYGLFPHMNVWENLRFAAGKQVPSQEIKKLIEEMRLTGLEKHRPSRLSGGQQQRVALARVFLRKPAVLLLDEPLSSLDNELRVQLQRDLKLFQQKLSCTTLLVSHDPAEVARLADEVIMLDKGKITYSGTPVSLLGGEHEIFAEVVSIPAPGKICVWLGQQIITIPAKREYAIGEMVGIKLCTDFNE